jgi:leucyl/phenylalanyl-tRNA---protein transferase
MEDHDVVAVGGDLSPDTLILAYSLGLFPIPMDPGSRAESGDTESVETLAWFSPNPRGVLLDGDFHASRSLFRSAKKMRITVDQSFEMVIRECANPHRPHGWITPDVIRAYTELHHLGIAHSIEVRDEDDTLIGGLYGVELGGLFAAESKFHLRKDASKVAVLELARRVFSGMDASSRLIDVQWATPHLMSLGVQEISREEYQERLSVALSLPPIFS